ncbi:MAG: TRAP transporter small permease [Eubacteriales bacterium]
MNLIGKIELIVAKIFFLLTCLLLFINIIMRYFIRKTVIWIYPLVSVLVLWCIVLCISYVIKKKGHISISFIKNLFSKRNYLFIEIIVYLIMTVTFLILLFNTINIFPIQRQRIIFGLGIPVTYYTAAIFYLALSGMISCAQFFFLDLKKIILIKQNNTDFIKKTKIQSDDW